MIPLIFPLLLAKGLVTEIPLQNSTNYFKTQYASAIVYYEVTKDLSVQINLCTVLKDSKVVSVTPVQLIIQIKENEQN